MHFNRIINKVVIMAVALLVITGCQGNMAGGPRIGFYLVQEASASLENIRLSDYPLLTENDIISYNWDEHQIVFTNEGFRKLPTSVQVGVEGIPFVLVVDGRRCYLGAFWTGMSSLTYPNPVIDVMRLANNAATIQRAYPQAQFGTGEDPRPNTRLKQVLTELKKLN